jgi:hypothetical protein
VRRWGEMVIDRKKWKDIVRLPKPTAGCNANGRKRKKCLVADIWFNNIRELI